MTSESYMHALEKAHSLCESSYQEVKHMKETVPVANLLIHMESEEARRARGAFERLLVSDDYGDTTECNELRVRYARMCETGQCCYGFYVEW